MSRIPYPTENQLSPAKLARKYDKNKRLLNVSHIAMHSTEGMWQAFVNIGAAAILDTELDPALRELVICRQAYHDNADYELFHHLSIARSAGISEEKLEAVRTGDYSMLPENERALLRLTDEVVKNTPSDEAVAEFLKHFSLPLLFETTLLIGHYMMTARVASVGGVENEDTAVTAWWKRK
jgi:alkylhydroperoxidase family enzyme